MTVTRFSVRTAVAVVGLVSVAALFAELGVWQLRRASENGELAEKFAAGTQASPLTEPPVSLTGANRFHRLRVQGEYVVARQFLLDNMLHDGAAGYHVLTLLRIEGWPRGLIVNRGWIGAGPDRNVLPDVAVPTQPRTIAGRIEHLPQPAIRLAPEAANLPADDNVKVLDFPNIERLSELLREPLYEYQLLLDPDESDGYVRDWRAPGIAPERNLAYAGQWLLLAVGALGAAVTIGIRSTRRRS